MALKTIAISVAEAASASEDYTDAQIALHAGDLYLGSMTGLALMDETAALGWVYSSGPKTLTGFAVGSVNSSNIATASGFSSYVVGSKILLVFSRQTTTSSSVPWAAQSGTYLVSTVGTSGTSAVLVRDSTFTTLADANLGAFVNVLSGTYAATAAFLSSKGGGAFDATPIVFSQVGTGTPGNLPVATGAGAYPRSTGVGNTYTASFPVLQGTLAARPAAAATLQGTSYLATDQSPPLLYLCAQTGASTYDWYLQGAGTTAADARASIGAGTSSVGLSVTAPAALGVTAVGVGTTAARSDHVHALPTAGAIGALSASSLSDATPAAPGAAAPGVATSVSRSDHVHTPTTAAQVGLGAVTATGADAATARTVISAVGTTRTISTTSPLTGGGDLSANRTFGIDTATLAPPWVAAQSSTVQTTDATTTTCGTYTVPAGTVVVKILVKAAQSDLTNATGWEILAVAVNSAGTVTIPGTPIVTGPTDVASTWLVALDVSGTTIRLRVTGTLATTVDWSAKWIVG